MPDADWLTEEIFVVPELLDPAECQRLINFSESIGYEEALLTSPEGPVRVAGIRDNMRVIHDDPELADQIWQLIKEFVPASFDGKRPFGVNERFRFYRYEPGQQFDWHQDHAYENDDGDISCFTMLIYLNEDFEGGETSFDDSCSEDSFDEFQVTPETGMGVFFAHHVHHKGEPTQSGLKCVLRSDVMFTERRRKKRRR